MSTDGQGTKWRKNIPENFNRLSRVHQRYRQTTDRQTDRRWHIANMNLSSRSLKISQKVLGVGYFLTHTVYETGFPNRLINNAQWCRSESASRLHPRPIKLAVYKRSAAMGSIPILPIPNHILVPNAINFHCRLHRIFESNYRSLL